MSALSPSGTAVVALTTLAIVAGPMGVAEAARGWRAARVERWRRRASLVSICSSRSPCQVGAGTYQFANVNVITGGSLIFADATIDGRVLSHRPGAARAVLPVSAAPSG
jgi:hypothetical protein